MNPQNRDDMKAEVNFSGGVRGKYLSYWRCDLGIKQASKTCEAGSKPASAAPFMQINELMHTVRSVLSPDLLNKEWAKKIKPNDPIGAGHCYIAAEAVWHLLGGKESGLYPHVISKKNWTHWYLRSKDGLLIVDPTADQHDGNYRYGRKCGFLTQKPSKRAAEIIKRIGAICQKRINP